MHECVAVASVVMNISGTYDPSERHGYNLAEKHAVSTTGRIKY